MGLLKKLAVLATATITFSLATLGNVNAQNWQPKDWKAAYRAQLKYMTDHKAAYHSDSAYTPTYTINDIDKDGIKELIVRIGTCEADFQFLFYTYSNGQVISLGSKNAGHTYLSGCDGNGIYLCEGHQGYESLQKLTKQGNNLYTTNIYSGVYSPYDYNLPKPAITEINATDYSYLPY